MTLLVEGAFVPPIISGWPGVGLQPRAQALSGLTSPFDRSLFHAARCYGITFFLSHGYEPSGYAYVWLRDQCLSRPLFGDRRLFVSSLRFTGESWDDLDKDWKIHS